MPGVPPRNSLIYVEYDVKPIIRKSTKFTTPSRKKIMKSFLGVVLDNEGTTYFEDDDIRKVGDNDTWSPATHVTNERETELRTKADKSLGPLPDQLSAAYRLVELKQYKPHATGKTRIKRKPTKRKPKKRTKKGGSKPFSINLLRKTRKRKQKKRRP